MTDTPDIYRRAAAAIADAALDDLLDRGGIGDELSSIKYRDEATWQEIRSAIGRASLSALHALAAAEGARLWVPMVATVEMRAAAHAALYWWREARGDPQSDPTNPEKHAIRYAAMLAAAPNPLETPDA